MFLFVGIKGIYIGWRKGIQKVRGTKKSCGK